MVKMVFSSTECEEARAMEGRWTNNSFTYLETKSMVETISLLKREEPLECLGVIGRISTEDDHKKYDIPVNTPWWLPTEECPNDWYKKILPELKEKLTNLWS
eukprot:GFUD01116365.1.p1 GENE.GFUD01116365.1~~GFUD01116365.1.p1  ORF type:complete len:102 (-),score=23.23 GFUD01116365.1:4-309(-)